MIRLLNPLTSENVVKVTKQDAEIHNASKASELPLSPFGLGPAGCLSLEESVTTQEEREDCQGDWAQLL